MALPDGTLCETDVTEGQTYPSKLVVSCDHISDDKHPVIYNAYTCYDSACSNCSDTIMTSSWQSQEDIEQMLNEDPTQDACQVMKTMESKNLDQFNDTNLETMFSNNSDASVRYGPADQARAYAEVYIFNTCLIDYISIEPKTTDPVELVTEEPVEIQVLCPPGPSPGPPGPSPAGESNVFGGMEAGGSSAASNVWGLSLSMFAVAGLSAAILSV